MVVIFSSYLSLTDRPNSPKNKCDMKNTMIIVDLVDCQLRNTYTFKAHMEKCLKTICPSFKKCNRTDIKHNMFSYQSACNYREKKNNNKISM